MKAPRFVVVAAVAGLVSLVLSVLIAWQLQHMADVETEQDCERAVAARGDSRAMWLYLIDSANPDRTPAEQKRFDAFVVELDKRLPPLKCDDGNFVPDRADP